MDFPLHLTRQLREHLRSLRKARGLTQAGLGRLLGVGQARIAEIESNPGAVSVDQLMRLVSALQATLVLRDEATGAASGPTDPDAAAAADAAGVLRVAEAPPTRRRTAPASREAAPDADAAPAGGRGFVIPPRKGSW
jgi:HTH-type transcriptional regulator/antitoxin HipB